MLSDSFLSNYKIFKFYTIHTYVCMYITCTYIHIYMHFSHIIIMVGVSFEQNKLNFYVIHIQFYKYLCVCIYVCM